ncbi:hypothetical protein [Bacillus phage YungSlug]|nr:hypothetical protein [Bacillus phage YungSlug]
MNMPAYPVLIRCESCKDLYPANALLIVNPRLAPKMLCYECFDKVRAIAELERFSKGDGGQHE